MKRTWQLALGLVLIAVASRLIPHWPNFTALGATTLLGAYSLKNKKWALALPLLAIFLSDLLLNNLVYAQYYNGFQWFTDGALFLYGATALVFLVGYFGITKNSAGQVGGASLIGALVFYLVTNFGVWLGSPLYAPNFFGLISSYIAGLPFLLNGALGNLVFSAILFYAFSYFSERKLVDQRV